jgi:hypothetical protein
MQRVMQRKKENGTDAENGAGEFAEPNAEVVQNFVQ